nr:SDR family oxidoreductase [Ensifer sp. ENS09]
MDGRRALVTGASRGIGFACAAALSQAGAHVFMAARDKGQLAEGVSAVAGEGGSAQAIVLDVTDPANIADVVADLGPIDVLVNNAGVARHSPMVDTRVEDFDAVVDVNLRGAYFVSQAVARGMISRGEGGVILSISSQMGHVGGIDRAVYAATKHAIEGMTKSAAIEFGRYGIRVNTVCPTFIRTPLTEATFADTEKAEWIASKMKLGRVAELEDVMGAVVFLASDAAAMITGTSLLVDGGWTAG